MTERPYNVLFRCTGSSARSNLAEVLMHHVEHPAAIRGSDAEKVRAFRNAFETLQVRIKAFVSFPIRQLTRAELKARLKAIGKLRSGATA